MMNMQKLMAQAKKMQADLEKKTNEFNQKEFEFNYKNSITVKIKGTLEIIGIDINKTLIDPDDKTMLEEMVAEAINEAISDVSQQKDKITQINLPKMPF